MNALADWSASFLDVVAEEKHRHSNQQNLLEIGDHMYSDPIYYNTEAGATNSDSMVRELSLPTTTGDIHLDLNQSTFMDGAEDCVDFNDPNEFYKMFGNSTPLSQQIKGLYPPAEILGSNREMSAQYGETQTNMLVDEHKPRVDDSADIIQLIIPERFSDASLPPSTPGTTSSLTPVLETPATPRKRGRKPNPNPNPNKPEKKFKKYQVPKSNPRYYDKDVKNARQAKRNRDRQKELFENLEDANDTLKEEKRALELQVATLKEALDKERIKNFTMRTRWFQLQTNMKTYGVDFMQESSFGVDFMDESSSEEDESGESDEDVNDVD